MTAHSGEPYINKHILAAKDAQIAQYAIALKVANEEAEGMRKEIDNLRKIAVEENNKAHKLRMKVLELERVVKAWTDHKKEAGM